MATDSLSAKPDRPAPRVSESRRGIWRFALLALLVAVLYRDVLAQLATEWWTDESASYGMLMPPLALFMAWRQRSRTISAPCAPDGRGLIGVFAACLLFLVGSAAAGWFLARTSLILLLASLAWTFWGGARVRALTLPLLLLAAMIPLPAYVYDSLTLPLQLLASRVSAEAIRGLGFPVYQEGNVIHLRELSLGIEEACSGLRSIAALAIMAVLLPALSGSRLRTRVAVLLAAIVAALITNVFRIAGTAILAAYNPHGAVHFYHSFSGAVAFAVGLLIVLVSTRALRQALD